jgi:hypothetical protein
MIGDRLRARLSAVARFFRRESVWVLIAAALSLALHAKYRLTGFGEQDAARLARDAISWHLRGSIWAHETSYRMHTSPGYIHLLKRALDFGLPIRRLPRFMNWLSVALGTGCGIALYALWRQFVEPRHAAMALFLYSVTPGFWMGNVYGMPTIPALGAFALSLLAFVRATRLPSLRSRWLPVLIAASFACLFWSLAFKADLVLCTGAFLAAAIAARGRRFQALGLASIVVLGAQFSSLRYVRAVLSYATEQNTGQFLQNWHSRFPFERKALLDAANGQTIVHCVGGVLFIVLVVAILGALFAGGRLCRVALAALVWGLPPILFWGFQFGNHVRHSVFGFAPLFLVVAHFVFRVVGERTWRAVGFALCLVGISYFSDTKGRGAVSPASNLLGATERLEDVTQGYHRSSRAAAASPSLKRAVIDGDVLSPYLDFEVFAAAKHPVVIDGRELHDGPQVTMFAHSSNRQAREIQREFRRQGFQILAN